jgi:PAS domain S-box-containing protein/putative nucleotidyltransferase with HDIG domain
VENNDRNKSFIADRETKKVLENIFEFFPDPAFIIDNYGRVLQWNIAIEEMTGIKKKEIIRKGNFTHSVLFYGEPRPVLADLVLLEEQERQKYLSYYENFEEKGETLYGEVYTKNLYGDQGAYIWAKASPLRDHRKNVIGAIEVLRDITRFKELEISFRQKEQRLDIVLENMRDIVGYIDLDGIVQLISPSHKDVLGYEEGEFNGKSVFNFVHPEDIDEVKLAFKEMIEDHSLKRVQYRCKHSQGHYLWFESIGKNTKDEKGNITGVVIGTRDITDQKYAEQENERTLMQLRSALEGIVQAIIKTVETRDPYTAGHQRRVAQIACAIAKEIGLPKDRIEATRIAALIHDIGKINVPSEILTKPGKIDENEWNIIKTHPEVGYDILKEIEFPWPIADIIIQHHERINGTGYPSGMTGEEISIEAKILAVADVVEAMSSHRPYRPALGIEKALEEITAKKGEFFWDNAVDACVKLFRDSNFRFQ